MIEDDAQAGPDHVNAHRTIAFVAGPYVKQGAVVHERYSTVNMVRTIEDVLGLEHLNINDEYQRGFDLSCPFASGCQVAEEAPRPDPNAHVVLAGKDISSVCI